MKIKQYTESKNEQADYGDVVNNSVTNNSKGTTQNNDRSVSEVMNKDLFLQLNLGNQLPDTI